MFVCVSVTCAFQVCPIVWVWCDIFAVYFTNLCARMPTDFGRQSPKINTLICTAKWWQTQNHAYNHSCTFTLHTTRGEMETSFLIELARHRRSGQPTKCHSAILIGQKPECLLFVLVWFEFVCCMALTGLGFCLATSWLTRLDGQVVRGDRTRIDRGRRLRGRRFNMIAVGQGDVTGSCVVRCAVLFEILLQHVRVAGSIRL